ncbi:uroporphyrinogen decarboxylase family protein [Halarsenatibacter silvermanii]|uniref:Uroporphyrinogen decarboxylase n=1 Tax=Halarsenatibacter silvermanii TaxID=321763 RepID=A0A1G9GUH9_9FIRM|nr:uroporphyrinogen decarboxylase family protein [Halarsenatibacter silvermanii]SDL04308.1 uroporphyrinogen decarboxylase [Halarsenatibacter silvermanii]
MQPRTRVEMALEKKEPDRCPLFCSYTPEFADRLRQDMDLKEKEVEEDDHLLERRVGQDMLLTSVGWATSYYQEEGDYVDEWGVGWQSVEYETRFGQGRYTEMTDHPLAADEMVDDYQPPDPDRDHLYQGARRKLNKFRDKYYICGGVVTTIFETAWALRGLDRLLMDFLEKPELAEKILDIPYEYHRQVAKRLTRMGVDMIWLGDDMGAQDKMLISPQLWRKFFRGKMANIISEVKEINPDVKVAYHSDGYIKPIIPDLIDIGLDVLNPVQPKCMDPARLKEEFGDRLCFWGAVDEQETLPFGSREDVISEVKKRLKTVGRGGGFIIGPTHHLQLDTPLENFWAMVDTVKKTGYSNWGNGN